MAATTLENAMAELARAMSQQTNLLSALSGAASDGDHFISLSKSTLHLLDIEKQAFGAIDPSAAFATSALVCIDAKSEGTREV